MTGSPHRWLTVRRTTAAGVPLVTIEVLAREADLHPDLVERLLVLGALEPSGGTSQAPVFSDDGASRLARVVRLRHDLGLNFAGAILATDLIARIEALEEALSGTSTHREGK